MVEAQVLVTRAIALADTFHKQLQVHNFYTAAFVELQSAEPSWLEEARVLQALQCEDSTPHGELPGLPGWQDLLTLVCHEETEPGPPPEVEVAAEETQVSTFPPPLLSLSFFCWSFFVFYKQKQARAICAICQELFDDGERCPRVLPCGHTVCSGCVAKLQKVACAERRPLVCPFDRQSVAKMHAFPNKNFALLDQFAKAPWQRSSRVGFSEVT